MDEDKESADVKSALAAIGLELGLEQADGAPVPESFAGRKSRVSLGKQFTEG